MIPFNFARIPKTIFKPGCIKEIDEIYLVRQAKSILLVTGASSFKSTDKYQKLCNQLRTYGRTVYEINVTREPSPELIDEQVNLFKSKNIELVISIGGGSVIDAGKAISAMLTQEEPVMAYLEGVGEGAIHNGVKIPFIAVPTTSGTGSEATKNAVLSNVGNEGYKKSLRHDNFVPDIALLDPELTVTCPANVSAASGLDALTQLLGSYVSTNASPMTDALALSGLNYIRDCLIPVCTTEGHDIDKRAGMCYAAYISGITLANAGLGIVHGFASSIGGYFDISHGVLCGTLLSEAVKLNIELLLQNNGMDNVFLKKYAKVGSMFTGCDEKDIYKSCHNLIDILNQWTIELKMPRLKQYGITEKHIDKIIKITSNKNNPVDLTFDQRKQIVLNRL